MPICGNCFREKNTNGPCPFCSYDGADQAAKYPRALPPGSILNGRYILGRVLGQGGFGITYVAWDDRTQERAAIKEYFPGELASRTFGSHSVRADSAERQENFEYGKARFLEEARTLAGFIGNEHVVRISAYFEENGTAYYVMEYIEGPTLQAYMGQFGGRLGVKEAKHLLLPLMEAMEAVHEKGIVHRDIAPDNILITRDGTAKLIDFGAARYSTGEKSKSLDVILKHGFAPKEQYTRRGRQGPWTDVYAMAATFYYAITGRVPPDAIDRMDEDDLIPPSTLGVRIDDSSEEALLKALELNASERFQNMRDFRTALAGDAMPAARPRKEREAREAAARERAEREQAEKARLEREEAERLRREKQAEAARQNAAPKPAKKKSKLPLILGIIVALAAAIFGATRLAGGGGPAGTGEQGPEEKGTGLSAVAVGDYVSFGSYEQDNDLTNGAEPIEWLVLEKTSDSILVISKYALDCKPYNESNESVTWETCSLRTWLNSDFLNVAFSAENQARIQAVTVSEDKNLYYGTGPGNSTQDKVFLLSIPEAETYFPTSSTRWCETTAYAKANGCYANKSGFCVWWLRSPGSSLRRAAYVNISGVVATGGDGVNSVNYAVRPALWIDLTA